MSQDILISFILPIYKVEKFLHECIDSVLAQTYQNLEIILVDDGSPDKCPQICDEYAGQDNRIRVIHQENSGLSAARNAGLRAATGEYVIFLDSDDFHSNTHFVEELVALLQKNPVDMIMFKRVCCSEDGSVQKELPPFDEGLNQLDSNDERIYLLAKKDELECSAPMKILRREILVGNQCFFKPGIMSEDVEWFLRLLPYLKSVYVLNVKSYCYRSNSNSITHNINEKNIGDLTSIIAVVAKFWENSADITVKKIVLNYATYQFFIVLGLLHKIPANRRSIYYKQLREVSWITRYGFSKKVQKSKLVYSILGMYLSSALFGVYIRNK